MTCPSKLSAARRGLRMLPSHVRGMALTEFALALPVFMIMMLGGAEMANYMTVRMRVSQLALHVADNGARIGSGTQLQSQQISEAQINDLLTGANMQASGLDFRNRGRIVMSSLEADPANAGKYKIVWQRCFGNEPHTPLYGREFDSNMVGMGPTNVKAMPDGATIFVEVNYRYRPLVTTSVVRLGEFTEIASMAVRDRRDLTKIYNSEMVTRSMCT